MNLVIIESPYAGDVAENTAYARACMRACLKRGEAPYASHLLYTQNGILDDDDPDERALGIEAGLCWGVRADKTVVYVDRGISPGMMQGIERAREGGREIVFRSLVHKNKTIIDHGDPPWQYYECITGNSWEDRP